MYSDVYALPLIYLQRGMSVVEIYLFKWQRNEIKWEIKLHFLLRHILYVTCNKWQWMGDVIVITQLDAWWNIYWSPMEVWHAICDSIYMGYGWQMQNL